MTKDKSAQDGLPVLRLLKRGSPTPAEAAIWQEANREAIEFYNDYVKKHGLPLAKFRQF